MTTLMDIRSAETLAKIKAGYGISDRKHLKIVYLGINHFSIQNKTEAETNAMIDLILENPFVLAISFHSGALVANYPWNDGRVRDVIRRSLSSILLIYSLKILIL